MTKLEELIAKLSELFELDKADLDFGIHRIIKSKHKQVREYLETRLPQQVEKHLGELAAGESASQLKELQQEIASSLGADAINEAGEINESYANTPLGEKYQLVRDSSSGAQSFGKVENEVYSHLLEFFSRYYEDADFMSLRRRTAGRESYAIPYNGEEVVLHWANKDQYYIKSSEDLKDYTFTVPLDSKADGKKGRVQFRLTKMDAVQNNNKASRIFQLDEEKEITSSDDGLVIPFHFAEGKSRGKAVEAEWEGFVLHSLPEDWQKLLSKKDISYTGSGERNILQKHLRNYTKKNTSDYFIHKDLGGFLRRELDFYVKNEVMFLDDIENRPEGYLNCELRKIKAIRAVAQSLIVFLNQFEDFQRKLWLKKKIVVETNWCISLAQIPETLYSTIASNEEQRKEWVSLFGIDQLNDENDLAPYSTPLTVDFLRAHSMLLVDTKHFDHAFRQQVEVSIEDIEKQTSGLLVHADNFQALNLVQRKYLESVKCIYIDPPYNTGSSAILYKNSYKHSSWGTMIFDRVRLLHTLLPDDGAIFVSIDKTERTILEYALDSVFGVDNRIEELIWAMNTNNSQAPNYSTNHEYVLVYAKNRIVAESIPSMFREPKPGYEDVMALVAELAPSFPPVSEIVTAVRKLYKDHKSELKQEAEANDLDWEREKRNDPWKGIYNYNNAEYRDQNGDIVDETVARKLDAKIWIWREDNSSMPAAKQATSTKDPEHENYRFYKPPHPLTGKPCPHPKSGWKFRFGGDDSPKGKRTFQRLDADGRIVWGEDENKVPQIKRMLHEVETNIGKSVFQDYSDGEKETSAMFGESGIFLAPKHSSFVSRFFLHAADENSTLLDCFGGSGSSGHSVVNLNRLDDGNRKFVLVEMGDHFDNVLKPRILKSYYSAKWAGGKPADHSGGRSAIIKYIRLETYEDSLGNLAFDDQTPDLLGQSQDLKEEYLLRYCLDTETKGSLLDCEQFKDPFNYQLKIYDRESGEAKPTKVDLPETFNYLLGLKVRTMQMKEEALVIEGENPAGETVLVIWRNVEAMDNAKLNAFVSKTLRINTADTEYAAIYINGDTTLNDPHKKILLTEQVFHDLMFDVEDV